MSARDVSEAAPTVHASAVLIGAGAVLIRGPSGSGKSRLAFALLQAAGSPSFRFARLVADDRVHLETVHGRLIARAPATLAGLIELRGIGILRVPYEPAAVISRVIDLAAEDGERMPDSATRSTEISGVRLPRLAVAPGVDPLPILLAALAFHTET